MCISSENDRLPYFKIGNILHKYKMHSCKIFVSLSPKSYRSIGKQHSFYPFLCSALN